MEKPPDTSSPHPGALAGIVHRNIQALLEERHKQDARMSRQQRIAAGITAFTGSMPFVYLHALLVIGEGAARGHVGNLSRFSAG